MDSPTPEQLKVWRRQAESLQAGTTSVQSVPPGTMLALLDEVERLRATREGMADELRTQLKKANKARADLHPLKVTIKELQADKARLDWLADKGNGCGLIHDDFESWAVLWCGMQPACAGNADGWHTMFMANEENQWRDTIRQAIDAAMGAGE